MAASVVSVDESTSAEHITSTESADGIGAAFVISVEGAASPTLMSTGPNGSAGVILVLVEIGVGVEGRTVDHAAAASRASTSSETAESVAALSTEVSSQT